MKLGIIGGSGLDNPELLSEYKEIQLSTPYGGPSSIISKGFIGNTEIMVISRHGKNHEITPNNVNNRANIYALKEQGCTHIIATTAVGSLREKIGRGEFVILSDFIDFTRFRKNTFYDNFKNGVVHAGMSSPFSEFLRLKAIKSCEELNIKHHKKGTVVTIEGPRFSTRAESQMFRQWGADVINMSIAPEAILANEAGIEYCAIAMSTDYDCWKTDEEPVSWEDILKIFSQNSDKMKKLLLHIAKNLGVTNQEVIKLKIRTVPDFPKKGIMFRDVTTLIKDKDGFKAVMDELEKRYKKMNIDLIAGVESRGFIIASALADRLNKGVVLIRKKGKLPSETVSESYDLEYGKAEIEIHKDAINKGDKVLLLDDLIATAGTCLAAAKLINKLGGDIVECGFIVELNDLGGRKKLEDKGYKVFSLINFSGD